MSKRMKRMHRLICVMLIIMLTLGLAAPGVSAAAVQLESESEMYALSRELETESIVLLQNDNDLLPFHVSDPVAVFGRGQLAPTTGGSGSGAVTGAYTSTFVQGMEAIGAKPYQELLDYYKARISGFKNINHGWNQAVDYPGEWGKAVYSGTSWSMTAGVNIPDVKLDDGKVTDNGIVARARAYTDKAIVFITRTTGAEEMDRIKQPGDWYLDPSEKTLLRQVTDKFDEVAVIISTIGPIDMSWVREYDIDAVMISYAAGSQNGYALADLVFGIENPSGKLADTITETYEEHPTADTFGYTSYEDVGLSGLANNTRFSDSDPVSTYLEGIYNGHRYFDSFGKDVLYAFGSGLSYSDFEFSNMSVTLDAANQAVKVKATITNVTADKTVIPGKEVMEVYVSAPQVELEQPYQKLVDFEKTRELASGESQTIEISVPLDDLASYNEEKAAYVLESGYYYFRVGGSSRDTHVAGAIHISSEILVEQLTNRLTISDNAAELFEEKALTNKGATPITYAGEDAELAAARASAVEVTGTNVKVDLTAPQPKTIVFPEIGKNEPVYRWESVANGEISLEKFVSQMTMDEMFMLLIGNVEHGGDTVYYQDDPNLSQNFRNKNGGGGAGYTRGLERLGIPSILMADGSAGLGYNMNGRRNIGWPRAASIACVWNKDLLSRYAEIVGHELIHANVDAWLAPSINLHRNPLNGRNNEYYSEDPILSGIIVSIVAEGVAKSGVTVCLKHFAANDQEQYRRGHYNASTVASGTSKDAINIISTERALREITLKPFEMAVETGSVMSVMSSFNKINGEYAASSYDLLTGILQDEWGFEGFIVTDWGEADAIAHAGDMMIAGLDQIERGDHQMYTFADQIRERLAEGTLTEHQMRVNTYDFLNFIKYSALSSMEGKHAYRNTLTILSTTLPNARSNYEYSLVKTNPLVAAGGQGKTYTFSVASDSPNQLPEGLTLSPNGTLSGKAVSGNEGTYSIKFQVRDNTGATATKTLNLTVTGELGFAPETVPVVVLNEPYSQQITVLDADGNEVEAEFEMTGNLPAGITLSKDGLLSGTCTSIGSGTFTINVNAKSRTGNKTGQAAISVRAIESAVSIKTTSVADAAINAKYSQALSAEGGYGDYTWTAESLPEGFILADNQLVYGYDRNGVAFKLNVPESMTGVYRFDLTVTDELGTTDTETFTITVGDADEDAFALVTGSLPDGATGSAYEVQLETLNAEGNVSYKLATGSDALPEGLTLSAGGKLSGYLPYTAYGLYHIVIEAQDSAGSTDSATFALYVAGGQTVDPAPKTVLVAREGDSFGKQFRATGGLMAEKKYELHASSDPLPAGLSISTSSTMMTISGKPERGTEGVYHLVFVMDDANFSGNPVTSIVPYTLIVEPYMENLALNKPVVASSYHLEDNPPLHPQDTVDGDLTTRWCCDWQNGDVDNAWLKVDLGASYEISEIFIAWEPAHASEYKLLVSNDDVNYTELNVSWVNKDGLNHTWIVQGSGRYVMMQSSKAATQYGSSIYEFEVYGAVDGCSWNRDSVNGIIYGMELGTTMDEFKAGFETDVQVYNDGEEVTSGVIATGMTLEYNKITYQVGLKGDINGDGAMNVADTLALKNLILSNNWSALELFAGDMDGNGKLNVVDIILMKNLILAG